VSTTGDRLTASFLDEYGGCIDLISLPLDGSNEGVSSRTKRPGHHAAVMAALDLLEAQPGIDVKVATPVTRLNLADVPNIARLLDERAPRLPGRLFHNMFQAFPRSMDLSVAWNSLVVSGDEFEALRREVEATHHPYRINWLGHDTLGRLYAMVFPDGSLTIPSGSSSCSYGPFLEIDDLDELLGATDFDAPKHQRHAQGGSRSP
jgi:MoaA/NifB/PqqE/SkfB family radical SAM enzyme